MNTPIISQAGQIIAELYKEATGTTVQAPVDLSGYISVATTALNVGKDVLFNALTQMWGRTVFAVRPYRGAFRDMEFDTTAWGAAERKVSFLSRLPGANAAYSYPVAYDANETPANGDGLSVDMYKISKDKPVETVFYGLSTFAHSRTRFLNQLETAIRDPEEFVRYNAAAIQALENDREGWAESVRRGLVLNAIGSILAENQTGRIFHALTDYNADTGSSYTATDIFTPSVLPGFAKWLYAKLATIFDRMKENNVLYTTQLASYPSGYGVLRHTPADRVRVKLLSSIINTMRASVLSGVYNDDYLNEMLDLSTVESVAYWQAPANPDTVNVVAAFTGTDGAQTTATVDAHPVLGIIYDADMIGCTPVRSTMYTTPFNASGEYWNDFYKEVYRTRFDMTEKGLVIVLN